MTSTLRIAAGSVPKVLTIDEAAEILRVKRSWLEKMAAARRIPFSMLGGSYHFSPDHLWQIFAIFEEAPEPGHQEPTLAAIPIKRARHTTSELAPPASIPLRPRARHSRKNNQTAA